MSTTLYQLELDQTDVNCGMSYVVQLDDGRFVIIDGGYFTTGEQDRLFRFLNERSDGTPVIAVWFFTHPHQDHIGAFMLFVQKYLQSVELQRLMYNFHPADLSKAEGDWQVMANDLATLKEFYRIIDRYCPDIETITPHTGDTYQFGELHMEVIFTWEGLYPDETAIDHGSTAIHNNHSTVVRTTVDNYVTLWLADAGAKAMVVLLETPEKLACDMVQISHHGIDNHGLLPKLYAATEAQVVLWPTCDYGMVQRQGSESNQFILRDMGVSEHHVSGFGTSRLTLPYQPGTASKGAKALSFEKAAAEPSEWLDGVHDSTAYRYVTPLQVDGDR